MKKLWKSLTMVLVIAAMLCTLGACKSDEEKAMDAFEDALGDLSDMFG